MRCDKCGCSVHKRTNEAAFNDFINSTCIDQAHDKAHEGHASHSLWQKGDRLSCKLCGLQLHLDAQRRIILTLQRVRDQWLSSPQRDLQAASRTAKSSRLQCKRRAKPGNASNTLPSPTPRPTSSEAPVGHDTQPLLVTPPRAHTHTHTHKRPLRCLWLQRNSPSLLGVAHHSSRTKGTRTVQHHGQDCTVSHLHFPNHQWPRWQVEAPEE